MDYKGLLGILLAAGPLLITGCATSGSAPKANTPAKAQANQISVGPVASRKEIASRDQALGVRNQAYSILYQLMSDEANLSKLLLVKKEQPDVGQLIKDISKTAADAARQFEAFSKADPHLHLEMQGLPLAEKETRDLIGKTRAKELLTKTGQKFELRVLLTQSEALTYAAHLAIVTQSHETDAARNQYLGDLSRQLQDLHQRLIDLMHSRWQMPTAK